MSESSCSVRVVMRAKTTISEKKYQKFDMKTSMNSGLSPWNYHENQRDHTRDITNVNFVPK